MKYKCTDCGQEYDLKPEFCDCGNNDFEEISDNKFENLENIYPQTEFKPEPRSEKNVDIPSIIIFVLCLILSVLSLIFIGRDIKTPENLAEDNKQEFVTKDIPSIDKLWHETKPKANNVVPQQIPEPVAIKTVENTAPKVANQNVTVKKTNTSKTNTTKTNTTKTPVNNTSKPKQNTQTQSVTTQTQSQPQPTMTEQEKQEIIKKLSTKKTPSSKTEPKTTEQPKNESNQVVEQPKQEPVKTEVKPEVKAPDPQQLKKELDAYKVALRNRLGKAINFGAVIGDGKCAVTFKIDQTGNLVSRKFSTQSQNNSLNDAVYAAFLNNPTYSEPPAGYSGETLTLTVSMYGGNFEVTLK